MSGTKIGVLGVGHLGKIHLKCLHELGLFQIAGVYDPNSALAKNVSEEFNLPLFSSVSELIDTVEAVDIVAATKAHFELAKIALEKNKHIFIEKPVTANISQAEDLLKMASGKSSKIQVGHVERFNPAFYAVKDMIRTPLFIEAHRLAPFNPRGTDVSVMHDLMIHDLDLISHVVNSKIRDIRANGVPILSPSADICNVRLEFNNNCVCNITASRVSMTPMRKMRIFQEGHYLSLDLLNKEVQIIELHDQMPSSGALEIDTYRGKRYVHMPEVTIQPINAILEELRSFYYAIQNNTRPEVNLDDGYQALKLVSLIDEKLATFE